ncbi:MAG: AMP-binding protein, partial [Planctomycetia bacterium]
AASFADLLLERLDESFDRPAICDALDGGRTWTWGQVIAAAVELAAARGDRGLGAGDRIAHLGPHTPDWIVVDLASQLAGFVHVPLHADSPPAELAAVLGWVGPRCVVRSGPAGGGPPLVTTADVLDLRAGRSGRSEWPSGVLLDPRCHARGQDRHGLRAELVRRTQCDPDACGVVLLSSGTTGRPKGVMHSQRALVTNARLAADQFLDDPRDVRLSWLPMSHALARTGDLVTTLVRGGCLNVVTDRRRVLDACRVLPPTVVLGVPAFFERLERAFGGTKPGGDTGLAAALGGRVRVCVSGGAPLRERTVTAFARHGIALVSGYGLAEAGPVVTVATPRTARSGTVGLPLAGVELVIDERPDTRGQLLVRTPCRALGVIDETGRQVPGSEWLETGDRAEIDGDGHLRITGRVVDTLVLAGGSKMHPADVEAALAEDPAVAQVCVTGAVLPSPVALVVPEPDVLRAAMRRMGVTVTSRRAALGHPRVLRWLGRRLARRQARLPKAWRVRRAVLLGRGFEAERDEVTPSLKLKRSTIANHFASEIAAAAEPRPRGPVALVPSRRVAGGDGAVGLAGPGTWAAAVLWDGPRAADRDADGFAIAAEAAAEPLGDGVQAVVTAAEAALAQLRRDVLLYDEAIGGPDLPAAPLADPPPRTRGTFSEVAEDAAAAAGLWGLFVPARFDGAGCTVGELARVVTRLAADVPTAAGTLAVHSTIGAVSAVATFGSPEQQARLLPGLARGRPLSIFGATEPDAGCDLQAIGSTVTREGDRLLLTGTKMFITGAAHGRLVKLLARVDGRPSVLLVRLPDADSDSFRLRRYALHPLKHARNAALEFDRHPVDGADILVPPPGAHDGMRIVWHGLNRGRITLAAQAAGTLRILATQAVTHALARRTWGEPIASRELVRGRLARIAAGGVACEALAAWAAAAIDAGGTGELEAIVAKIVASECVRDGAVASLGVHGGRAFLVGHPLGDSLHDHLAVTVYEGESELLGLALFKGLARHHPLAGGPREASSLRRAAGWLAWRASCLVRRSSVEERALLDRRLRDHARAARGLLAKAAVRIDRGVRRHGARLADRQLLIGGWSAEFRDLVSVLAVAHHADAIGDDASLAAADCWCRLALARA